MRGINGLAAIAAALGAAAAFAAEPAADPWDFTSATGKRARASYHLQIRRAMEEHEATQRTLRLELLRALDQALKAATQAEDLTEARRIQAARDTLVNQAERFTMGGKNSFFRPVRVASRLEGKRGASALNRLAVVFDGPMGDGRKGAKGVLVNTDPVWRLLGTQWSFRYARSKSAFGVQILHPFEGGQVIVHVGKGGVGMSTPKAWTEVGYRGGNHRLLKHSEAYEEVFPLKEDEYVQIASILRPDGEYTLKVNGDLVASAKIRKAHPLSYRIWPGERFPVSSGWAKLEFKGDGFHEAWQPGFAGILVEPLDNGKNIVADLQFTPGIIKLPPPPPRPKRGPTIRF